MLEKRRWKRLLQGPQVLVYQQFVQCWWGIMLLCFSLSSPISSFSLCTIQCQACWERRSSLLESFGAASSSVLHLSVQLTLSQHLEMREMWHCCFALVPIHCICWFIPYCVSLISPLNSELHSRASVSLMLKRRALFSTGINTINTMITIYIFIYLFILQIITLFLDQISWVLPSFYKSSFVNGLWL